MKKVILIKVGEIFLKGLNRPAFEKSLINNIRKKLKKGEFELKNSESTICLFPQKDNIDFDYVLEKIKKVFGISVLCQAFVAQKNIKDISDVLINFFKDDLSNSKSFKIASKRSDKNFEFTSCQISQILGSIVLENYKNLRVDLCNPELIVNIEVRKNYAFLYSKTISGSKGMPVGTSSKSTALISGGIDSPVAIWMMAKRGSSINAVHFASPPYTNKRSEDKVVRLVEKLSQYCGNIKLFIVGFTKIQEEICRKCRKELHTIINRRMMMKISENIAKTENSKSLVTGESLAQVASQTIDSIICTNAAVNTLVLRPLIGMDKDEIINIAKKIETFDISIEPFQDCCTVFTPKHPNTRPDLNKVLLDENNIDSTQLISDTLSKNIEIKEIK
ncbi:MAG: tRNA 4-thiouridine(8) synthase ThiI [Oscillospiraceae bacterium]|jgi:thiamine biosynthesis protein ThiI|nr:tRNA 4-thiouridine(8) synthase ThiI [Oscillospiraceae bacterium]